MKETPWEVDTELETGVKYHTLRVLDTGDYHFEVRISERRYNHMSKPEFVLSFPFLRDEYTILSADTLQQAKRIALTTIVSCFSHLTIALNQELTGTVNR